MQENPQDDLPVQDELTALKLRADRMGIQYHPAIGVDKLKAKIEEKLKGGDPTEDAVNELVTGSKKETQAEFRSRKKKEATEQIRIRVSCMNPTKKEWEGEIFTTGNSVIGTIKKYVPFNAEEGWHVPRIIYNQLVQRQCQIFVTVRDKSTGKSKKVSKLIKEFAVEVLPPLTEKELRELARRQAMSRGSDE